MTADSVTIEGNAMKNAIYFDCAEARFEVAEGNEFLVGFSRSLPPKNKKTFFTPLTALGESIGWMEFEYALTVHGKSFYRAIRLHPVGDVSPAASDICQLLSTPPLKELPDAS